MKSNQKINYEGGMDGYSIQIGFTRWNYDDLCQMEPELIQELRNMNVAQSKKHRNTTILTATIAAACCSYGVLNMIKQDSFGDYSPLVSSFQFGIGVLLSKGIFNQAKGMNAEKEGAKVWDKALVLVTGDAKMAHYKSTMKELVQEERFIESGTIFNKKYTPNTTQKSMNLSTAMQLVR